MSAESSPEVTSDPQSRTRSGGVRAVVASRRDRRLLAAAGALLATAAVTALRVLHNVPFDPLAVGPGVLRGVAVLGAFAVAVALAAVGLDHDAASVRVGCLFAAAFGALGTVADGAALPATLAVPAGGALALAGALGVPSTYREARVRVVAAVLVAAVALSLGSTTGVLPAGLREAGSVAALAALSLLVVRLRGDRVALGAGIGVGAAVLWATAAAPYVAGSALLVGFGVVGGPHVLVATAAGGVVAATVAGVRRGALALAAGALVLAAAGVPATPAAAAAVVLGALLVASDADSLGQAEPADATDAATEVSA
ncbi:hypothetical protein [Halorubellus litoreus]|uniref:Phosphate ABC transporter permease n=1 Tax=Halorubellus litoreus TaxID=755308 RepID=A0ABD5VHF2_9EURY